jgi:hypothetical protein
MVARPSITAAALQPARQLMRVFGGERRTMEETVGYFHFNGKFARF